MLIQNSSPFDNFCQNEHADCNTPDTNTNLLNNSNSFDKSLRFFEFIENAQKIAENAREVNVYQKSLNIDFQYWIAKGEINRKDFNRALKLGVHYQFIDGRIYRQKACLFPARCEGVEYFFKKIVKSFSHDLELVVNVHDYPKVSKHFAPTVVFSFSKTHSELDILYPAWSFWRGGPAISTEPEGLGRWDLKIASLNESAEQWLWDSKMNIAFFRGSRTSAERDPLILLSREKPHLVKAEYTKNQAWKSDKDTLGATPAEIVTLEEHCKYKYLFNFRGVTASFRFRHLFLCNSAVFHVGDDWIEFFYRPLTPWYHFIPISTSLEEVEEVLFFSKSHDNLIRDIANNGRNFMLNHLSMNDILDYWKSILTQYSKLVNWKVLEHADFILIQ